MTGLGRDAAAPDDPSSRDDRVLATTRALAAFIAPFLLVAFVLLCAFPARPPA